MSAQKQSDSSGFLSTVLTLGIISSPFWGYTVLNDSGWISRTRTIDIYMKGDWLVGESRVCDGIQRYLANKGPELSEIYCPSDVVNSSSHTFSVQFWGKVSRPDLLPSKDGILRDFLWRCTRHAEDFTCNAIN
jgi:hypothetical protein